MKWKVGGGNYAYFLVVVIAFGLMHPWAAKAEGEPSMEETVSWLRKFVLGNGYSEQQGQYTRFTTTAEEVEISNCILKSRDHWRWHNRGTIAHTELIRVHIVKLSEVDPNSVAVSRVGKQFYLNARVANDGSSRLEETNVRIYDTGRQEVTGSSVSSNRSTQSGFATILGYSTGDEDIMQRVENAVSHLAKLCNGAAPRDPF